MQHPTPAWPRRGPASTVGSGVAYHLAGISSGTEPASRTRWLGLPGSSWGSSWAGSKPGHSLLPGGPRTGAPQGGLSCRHGAAGTGQEVGRLPARSCWLESGHSERLDLSGSAAMAGRGGRLHKGPGIERREVIRVCGAQLGGSNK